MKILITILLACGNICYSQTNTDINTYSTENEAIKSTAAACDQILKAYDNDRDLGRLNKVNSMLSGVRGGSILAYQKRFDIRLKMLNRYVEARYTNYDILHIETFATQVVPPPVPGVHTIAGMNPEDIKDPALRSKYLGDIALNNSKMDKYNHEHEIQKQIHLLLFRLENDIKVCFANKGENEQKAFVDAINTNILNKQIKDIILSVYNHEKEVMLNGK
jgi:hypothetical protein